MVIRVMRVKTSTGGEEQPAALRVIRVMRVTRVIR